MIRTSWKVDKIWYRDLLEGTNELGAYVAGVFMSEFRDLLYSAPQRDGSYVASFRIGVNGVADGPTILPERKVPNWYYKGSEDAISAAMYHVGGVRAEAMAASYGLKPVLLTLENDVDYADDAETQKGRVSAYEGDPGNPGTKFHVAGYMSRVNVKLAARVYVGKSTWKTYVNFDL